MGNVLELGPSAISKKKIRFCILATATVQMCYIALMAAISDIAAFFPDYSATVIQTGVTAINLMAIGGALVSGLLSFRFPKKLLTILGFALVIIGGICGFFLHSTLGLFYTWSLVIGFGLGMFSPAVMSLLVDYFEGEERAEISGMQTSFINSGGVILTFVGGLLAAIAWHFSYLAFLAVVPVLIICMKNMPAKNRFPAERGTKQKIPPEIWYYFLTVFLIFLVYNTFPTNIALFLHETGLGDAAMAGGVNAVFMVGGVVMGLIFSRMTGRFAEYFFAFAHLMLIISFSLICVTESIAVVFIAAFIGGISISMTMPQAMYSVAGKIPPATGVAVFSLVSSVAPSLGSFASPAVMGFFSRFVTDEGDSISRFMAAVMLALVFAIVQFAAVARSRKNR